MSCDTVSTVESIAPAGESAVDPLNEAVARRSTALLWFRELGAVRTLTTQLVGNDEAGVWIATPTADATMVDRWLVENTEVAIAFKSGESTERFAAHVIRREAASGEDAAAVPDRLLLQRSAARAELHRRSHFRVAAAEAGLQVKMWRIADHVYFRDRPTASQRLSVETIDLSVGGIGVAAEMSETPIDVGQRVRVELIYGDDELLLEGLIRHIAMRDGEHRLRIGVEFKRLENDTVWRQSLASLTRIVGDIQRLTVRRAREAQDTPQPAAQTAN